MYSKEFMKFLYNYQKEEFKPKKPQSYEIHFINRGSGKPAEVTIPIENRK